MPEAQTSLGLLYARGDGVVRDDAEAARLYALAAAAGDATAQYLLGSAYDTGTGVPRNPAEAVRLYESAAQQGYAAAQHDLALMYGHGRNVRRDWNNALRWMREAYRDPKIRRFIDRQMTWRIVGVGTLVALTAGVWWLARRTSSSRH